MLLLLFSTGSLCTPISGLFWLTKRIHNTTLYHSYYWHKCFKNTKLWENLSYCITVSMDKIDFELRILTWECHLFTIVKYAHEQRIQCSLRSYNFLFVLWSDTQTNSSLFLLIFSIYAFVGLLLLCSNVSSFC